MDTHNEEPRQKRRVNGDVVDRREVKMALASIAAGMEEWHREAAFLKAMLGRNSSQADLKPRIFSLRKNVSLARKQLDEIVGQLPERLRDHGRVTDLRRALDTLEACMPEIAR
ncbi:MAG: hypothetical protein ABIY37_15780 [Devosia sp.]